MARAKKAPIVASQAPSEQGLYSVVVRVAGVDYPVSGATIPEALHKLQVPKFAGKIQLTTSHNNRSYTFDLFRPVGLLQKALVSSEHMALLEKRIKMFLNEV